jgi:alpha-L-fucosidase
MRSTLFRFLVFFVIVNFHPTNVSAQNTQYSEITTLEQFGGLSGGVYKPTEAERQRIAWFRDAKFGLFIHWGLYSQMAGYWKGELVKGGEWAIKLNKLPIDEYRTLANVFNPVKFNADEWVGLAKASGMKYIVITSKHHDGFAMYKSAASNYNIVDATPFGRDPIKELKEACDRHGIRLGLYYSHAQDWNEPDAYGNNWSFGDYKGDMDAYLEKKALPQIKELCEQYQPDIVWYDTPGGMTIERARKVVQLTRKSAPNALINSRVFNSNEAGLWDYRSGGDNEGYPYYQNVPWELCGTLNHSWAFKKWDTNFRPVNELLFHLIDAVSKNGNYLLNVGPTAEGVITEPYSERLLQMGKWLKVNGEAIYGCGGTAFGNEFGDYREIDGKRKFITKPAQWRSTTKKGKVFIHVIQWPENGKLELPPLKSNLKKASFLATSKRKVKFVQSPEKIVLSLPENAPDPLITVIQLDSN